MEYDEVADKNANTFTIVLNVHVKSKWKIL